jgi:adenosylmethionine-8-amino-7-oxononanoate aminotransferase
MPPYCVDEEALQLLSDTTRAVIDHAIDEAAACA